MSGPCVNNDGADTMPGRLLCHECEQRLRDAIARIGEAATPLLMVATRQANVNMRGNGGHTSPAEAPSPLRDDMWELYCETERLMRRLAVRFGYPKATDQNATVAALARTALTDPKPLLTGGDVLDWYEDITRIAERIHKAVEPARPRIAFGACPDCGGVVWGDPDEQAGRCARCDAVVGRRNVCDRLLAKLIGGNVTGTAKQLSDECARAGIRLPASTIRSWARRGKISVDANGFMTLSSLVPLLRKRSEAPKHQD